MPILYKFTLNRHTATLGCDKYIWLKIMMALNKQTSSFTIWYQQVDFWLMSLIYITNQGLSLCVGSNWKSVRCFETFQWWFIWFPNDSLLNVCNTFYGCSITRFPWSVLFKPWTVWLYSPANYPARFIKLFLWLCKFYKKFVPIYSGTFQNWTLWKLEFSINWTVVVLHVNVTKTHFIHSQTKCLSIKSERRWPEVFLFIQKALWITFTELNCDN